MSMSWALINITKGEFFRPGEVGLKVGSDDSNWFAYPILGLIHHLLITRQGDYKSGAFKGLVGEDVGLPGRWYGCIIVTGPDEASQDTGIVDTYYLTQYKNAVGSYPINFLQLADEIFFDIGPHIKKEIESFSGRWFTDKILANYGQKLRVLNKRKTRRQLEAAKRGLEARALPSAHNRMMECHGETSSSLQPSNLSRNG